MNRCRVELDKLAGVDTPRSCQFIYNDVVTIIGADIFATNGAGIRGLGCDNIFGGVEFLFISAHICLSGLNTNYKLTGITTSRPRINAMIGPVVEMFTDKQGE